jgi:hypothetical protein
MENSMRLYFDTEDLKPCAPIADSDELVIKGERIMLYVNSVTHQISIFTAEKGTIYAGWVIAH